MDLLYISMLVKGSRKKARDRWLWGYNLH